MASLENDGSNKQTSDKNIHEKTDIYEDEINLIDYFIVLWKRKSLILLGSVLPAFIVGLILFFSPRNYKVTYVYDVRGRSIYDVRGQSVYDFKGQSVYDFKGQDAYDFKGRDAYDFKGQGSYDVSNWNLNEKNYTMLLDRFYSAENTGKIVTKLQENGLNRYAKLISEGGGHLKEFVNFDVWPPYTDISRAKITEPSQLEHIRQLNAQLLNMTIVARPRNDIYTVSSVIRDNLENVIPVSVVEEHLNADIRGFRAKIAGIDKNRFNLDLALKTDKAVLAKLKNIKTPVSDRSASNIALQFDISGKTEYLPVEYQIQATESKTIQAERQITTNEETYNHYKDLLALNEKLLAELKDKMSSYYTIQQFRLLLIDLIDSYENRELKDYLNSYIKKVENRLSKTVPITENPRVSQIAKGTVKKTAIIFAAALMMSVFVAFLLEGLKRSKI